jgi:hypothetical protein
MPLPLVALAATAVSAYLFTLHLSDLFKDVRRFGRLVNWKIYQAQLHYSWV